MSLQTLVTTSLSALTHLRELRLDLGISIVRPPYTHYEVKQEMTDDPKYKTLLGHARDITSGLQLPGLQSIALLMCRHGNWVTWYIKSTEDGEINLEPDERSWNHTQFEYVIPRLTRSQH